MVIKEEHEYFIYLSLSYGYHKMQQPPVSEDKKMGRSKILPLLLLCSAAYQQSLNMTINKKAAVISIPQFVLWLLLNVTATCI